MQPQRDERRVKQEDLQTPQHNTLGLWDDYEGFWGRKVKSLGDGDERGFMGVILRMLLAKIVRRKLQGL